MTAIRDKALAKAKAKYDLGVIEHGSGLEKAPDDLVLWLNHLQEELIDGIMYVEKMLDILEKQDGTKVQIRGEVSEEPEHSQAKAETGDHQGP